MSDVIKGFLLVVLGTVIAVVAIMGLVKLGFYLFPSSPSLSDTSAQICKDKGGTPVLEDYGTAYKSCAINGKSDTRNVVRP